MAVAVRLEDDYEQVAAKIRISKYKTRKLVCGRRVARSSLDEVPRLCNKEELRQKPGRCPSQQGVHVPVPRDAEGQSGVVRKLRPSRREEAAQCRRWCTGPAPDWASPSVSHWQAKSEDTSSETAEAEQPECEEPSAAFPTDHYRLQRIVFCF